MKKIAAAIALLLFGSALGASAAPRQRPRPTATATAAPTATQSPQPTATPTRTSTASPRPTPSCPANWSATTLYATGDQVTYQGYQWTTGSANQGQEPGPSNNYWSIVKPCGPPPPGIPPAPSAIGYSPGTLGCVDNPTPCTISWTAVAGAQSYLVKYPISGSQANNLASTTTTSYQTTSSFNLAAAAVVNGVEGLRTQTVQCTYYVVDCVPCNTYPYWNASTAYAAGSTVSYDMHFYRAQAATVGETPGVAPVWQNIGRCG